MPKGVKGFQSGQSGNPGGRPKALADVIALAREHTVTAISTLARIAGDIKAPAAAQVAASTVLLDRGWGKALQQIEVRHSAAEMTDDELIAIVRGSGSRNTEAADIAKEPGGVVH